MYITFSKAYHNDVSFENLHYPVIIGTSDVHASVYFAHAVLY